MLYNSAEEQIKDMKAKSEEQVKLGKVVALTSGGMPKIVINGAKTESSKIYPIIASYVPKVGDVALLQKQGITYVVIGAVTDEATSGGGVEYALKDHNHDDRYAPIVHNHDTAYAAKTHNHDTAYAAKTHSHDEYQYPSVLYYGSGTSRQTLTFNNTGGSVYAYSNLSSSSSKTISYSFIPKSNTGYALGAAAYPYMVGFIDYLFAKNVGTPKNMCALVSSTYYHGTYIGNSSNKFTNAYITTIYGTVSSSGSDRRIKNKIADLSEKFKKLFSKLRPVSFVFNNGADGKTHTGFIAQEVEEAIKSVELDDIGIVSQDDGGQYYLNYNEFIAIQTAVIHDLQKRVNALEQKINEMETDNK